MIVRRGLPLLLAAAVVGLALPAAAERTTRHHDGQGRFVGRTTSSRDGGTARHYDERGRFSGRSERGRDGRIRRYDERGRFVGSSR